MVPGVAMSEGIISCPRLYTLLALPLVSNLKPVSSVSGSLPAGAAGFRLTPATLLEVWQMS